MELRPCLPFGDREGRFSPRLLLWTCCCAAAVHLVSHVYVASRAHPNSGSSTLCISCQINSRSLLLKPLGKEQSTFIVCTTPYNTTTAHSRIQTVHCRIRARYIVVFVHALVAYTAQLSYSNKIGTISVNDRNPDEIFVTVGSIFAHAYLTYTR